MSALLLRVLGVPLRAGSLVPGNESDASAWRAAGLFDRLRENGIDAVDEGDLAVPNYLPHHMVPPVRNWPGPRIVWDLLDQRLAPLLAQPGHLPLLLGCDCSVVVATARTLGRSSGDVYVLYLDGDFDDAAPDPAKCQSAAAIAVWLLTNPSPFAEAPPVPPANVTVIGWTQPSQSPRTQVHSLSLADVRRLGPDRAIRQVIDAIPSTATLLLHFDIDVVADAELPAAYFPHAQGLTLAETAALLPPVLRDPRLRLVEISEYATLRDFDRVCVRKLIDLLVAAWR